MKRMGNEPTPTMTRKEQQDEEEEVLEEQAVLEGRMSPSRVKKVPSTAVAAACMERLPLGVVSHIISFLSGPDLLRVACVNRDLCWMVEDNSLWSVAASSRYPHLKKARDILLYNNEWRALFLDDNRRNRSHFFDWDILDTINNTDRRTSETFTFGGFYFRLILDPSGNPYVQLPKPCISVYLACSPVPFDQEDAEATTPSDWECCCSFSLTIINQGKVRRDVTWHSNLRNDRFHAQTKEWGVHRLLSLRRLREPNSGFLGPNDSIRIQARLRLLYVSLRVFTTPSFHLHQGFGVIDPTMHPPFSYDVQQMTPVEKVRAMIAQDLGLSSPDQIRLWAVTQQWAESPAAPRLLLTDNGGPLIVQTSNHLDGVGMLRIWAEVSGDTLSTVAGHALPVIETVPDVMAAAYGEGDMDGAGAAPPAPVVLPPPPPVAAVGAAVAQPPAATEVPPTRYYLLFIKWYDPSQESIKYLTYLVLPDTASIHDVFFVVAAAVGHCDPEDLEAQTEISPAHWQEGSLVRPKVLTCPSPEAAAATNTTTTMEDPSSSSPSHPPGSLRAADIENGQVLTFYFRDRRSQVEAEYKTYLKDLLLAAHDLCHNTSPRNARLRQQRPSRLPRRLTFDSVVDMFERLGLQRFRVRNTWYEQQHEDARETLDYAIQGRHLGFCCDRCGDTDFVGPRYKCTVCYDYDLCGKCQGMPSAATHRYRFDRREWKREDYTSHCKDHRMQVILPIPHSFSPMALQS